MIEWSRSIFCLFFFSTRDWSISLLLFDFILSPFNINGLFIGLYQLHKKKKWHRGINKTDGDDLGYILLINKISRVINER